MRRAERGDGLEPRIAADAVIDMDDEIAGGKRLSFGQEVLGFPAFFRAADQAFAQHVLFGNDRQPLRRETVFQRPDGEVKPALALGHVAHVADRRRAVDLLVVEKPLQAFARALGIGGDDDLAFRLSGVNMIRQCTEEVDVLKLALGREVAPDAAARIQDAGAGRLRQGDKLHHPMPGDRGLPSGIVKIEEPRRTGLVDRIEPVLALHRLAAGVILVLDPLPPRQPRRGQLVVEHHGRAGKIVEERLEPFVEEGQPMLHPGMLAPGAHGFVERIVGARRAELDAVVLPEAGDRGLVEDHLRHRRELHHGKLLGRPLRRRIEAPRAVQDVAEKVEPDRAALPRRVDVDDAAAHRVVAGLGHRRGLRETHADEEVAQGAFVHAVADAGGEGGGLQHRARRQPLGRGVERGQQDEGLRQPLRQRRQRRHPGGGDIGIGRDPVIGQAVPGRKCQDQRIRREEGQGRPHRLHPPVVAGDMEDGHALRQLARDKTRVKALGRAGQGDVVAGGHARHLAFRAAESTGQDRDVEVLQHSPEGGDEDRDHAEHLNRDPVQREPAVQRLARIARRADPAGGRDRHQADEGQRQKDQHQRLAEFRPVPESEQDQRGQDEGADRHQDQPRLLRDVEDARDVDTRDVGQILLGLAAEAAGAQDHVIGNAEYPVRSRGPGHRQRDPVPEVGE